MASDSIPMAFSALVAAAMAVEAWRRFSDPQARLLRRFRKAPVTPVAGCVEGAAARLRGVVGECVPTLVAPASGDACVGFALRVVRLGLGDQSEPSRLLCAHTEVSAFDLRDASGVARVQPGTHSTTMIGVGRAFECTFGTAPDPVRRILARYGYDRRELGGAHSQLSCVEIVLVPGDRVSAYGVGRWEPDVTSTASAADVRGGPFRDAPKVLHLRSTPEGASVIERMAHNGT